MTERVRPNCERAIAIEEAREILGRDVLGREVVKKAFGIELTESQIPKLDHTKGFTQEGLVRAKELGQRLILRWDKAPDGEPLSMERMQALAQPQFVRDGKGKVLSDISHISGEKFFTTQVPHARWALVSKKLIPESIWENYLDQTDVIADYLKNKVFKGRLIPTEYRFAIDEFNDQKAEIAGLMTSETRKQAADRLAVLKINQLFRHSPVEVLYDMAMVASTTDQRYLPDMRTWTNSQSRHSYLVTIGFSDSAGADVSYWNPQYKHSELGVEFTQ